MVKICLLWSDYDQDLTVFCESLQAPYRFLLNSTFSLISNQVPTFFNAYITGNFKHFSYLSSIIDKGYLLSSGQHG